MSYILINRFSSEYINSLPVVRFNGKVVVVQSRGQEEEAVKLLRQERYVGFDTESKPAFKKGESYPISLVQLATKDTAYLLQLKKTKFSNALADFLSNNEIKQIGIGVKNDFTMATR